MSMISLSARHVSAVANDIERVINTNYSYCYLSDSTMRMFYKAFPDAYMGRFCDGSKLYHILSEMNVDAEIAFVNAIIPNRYGNAGNEFVKRMNMEELAGTYNSAVHFIAPMDNNGNTYIVPKNFYTAIKLLDTLIYNVCEVESDKVDALRAISMDLKAWTVKNNPVYDSTFTI